MGVSTELAVVSDFLDGLTIVGLARKYAMRRHEIEQILREAM